MMTNPNTVLGLSDGGAHCGLICDVSMPSYLLTHWVNGRSRGERLGLEQAISLQTSRTAAAYGFTDRGVLSAGKRADINLIDLDGMHLRAPEMVFDLPAGGRRLIQKADATSPRWWRVRSPWSTASSPGFGPVGWSASDLSSWSPRLRGSGLRPSGNRPRVA